MPCWTTSYNTVELKAANGELLAQTLRELGYGVLLTNGVFTATGNGATLTIGPDGVRVRVGQEKLVEQIKQSYAANVVKAAAQRFGFTLKTVQENKRYVMQRRF